MERKICPFCDQELVWFDSFGNTLSSFSDFEAGDTVFEKDGTIYKCHNEKCLSGQFDYFFYTRIGRDKLLMGYPTH